MNEDKDDWLYLLTFSRSPEDRKTLPLVSEVSANSAWRRYVSRSWNRSVREFLNLGLEPSKFSFKHIVKNINTNHLVKKLSIFRRFPYMTKGKRKLGEHTIALLRHTVDGGITSSKVNTSSGAVFEVNTLNIILMKSDSIDGVINVSVESNQVIVRT
jgi:hypothetical protein